MAMAVASRTCEATAGACSRLASSFFLTRADDGSRRPYPPGCVGRAAEAVQPWQASAASASKRPGILLADHSGSAQGEVTTQPALNGALARVAANKTELQCSQGCLAAEGL